jgi:putative MATE family efflux protein
MARPLPSTMTTMRRSFRSSSCGSVVLVLLLRVWSTTQIAWGFQQQQSTLFAVFNNNKATVSIGRFLVVSKKHTAIIGQRRRIQQCHGNDVCYHAATTALFFAATADEDADEEPPSVVPSSPSSSSLTGTERRRLDQEFIKIALPAFLQLTAEPLAGLVDTMYLGRYSGTAAAYVLGGAGVAISAQYAVAKLYNDPLLRTSISLVAATTTGDDTDEQSRAVSSALALAGLIGVVQMIVYVIFGERILAAMGVSSNGNPMYSSAAGYLKVRAYGTPAATLWLVANGIFRGLGDTKTPLLYSLLFTALNIILDPIFIFTLNWGAAGAAAGTTVAQYIALIPLLIALHRKVPIAISSWHNLAASLRQYVTAGTKVLIRTIAKVGCYAYCARQAALLGPIAAAAYNLTFQLGFAVTQICESIAIAVQTLLAREMGGHRAIIITAATSGDTATAAATATKKTQQRVRHLIQTSMSAGGTVAVGLSLLTYWRRDALLRSLTSDMAIRNAAANIFPVVLLTQVAKGFCYPVNGILMGGLDWTYTMLVMWLANIVCLAVLMVPLTTATNGLISLERIWWGLCAFMSTQVVFGVARYQSRTGPWRVLRPEP